MVGAVESCGGSPCAVPIPGPTGGSFIVVDASEPELVGGTVEIVPSDEVTPGGRFLVFRYFVEDALHVVEYRWPGFES